MLAVKVLFIRADVLYQPNWIGRLRNVQSSGENSNKSRRSAEAVGHLFLRCNGVGVRTCSDGRLRSLGTNLNNGRYRWSCYRSNRGGGAWRVCRVEECGYWQLRLRNHQFAGI